MTPGVFIEKAAPMFGISPLCGTVLHRALLKEKKFASHGRGRGAKDVSLNDAKWFLASVILYHAHVHKGGSMMKIPALLSKSYKTALESAGRALKSGKVEYSNNVGKVNVSVKFTFSAVDMRKMIGG